MQGWGDRNILSDEKHVLQGLTNTMLTSSQRGLYDFNAGKIVSATPAVKLQSNSSPCVHLRQEFGICFSLEGELLFVVIYKGEVGWEDVPGGAVSPHDFPFAALSPFQPKVENKKAGYDGTGGSVESPYSCRAVGSRMEAEETQLFLSWQHCCNLRNRSLPLGMGSASSTPPLPFLCQLWDRCYRIKSDPCCILSGFTSGTLWSVYCIFCLCFFVCYMS